MSVRRSGELWLTLANHNLNVLEFTPIQVKQIYPDTAEPTKIKFKEWSALF